MPIVPENISDLQFNERDLFLDVRLVTIGVNDSVRRTEDGFPEMLDFTGRPTFQTKFFQDGTGFGITNIKISTNASLQPIVDIEFKDLYGKTVFGELLTDNYDGPSYKALFQWPPPKFEFTFKGYLGKPVTWILNMKNTSTNYNSDDGSYTIKASFVPNQWGMFADIPFLYLFAAKRLKLDDLGSKADVKKAEISKKIESVIDLMYIGKKIDTVKRQNTKEYDKLVSALENLKRDPVGGIVSGIIKVGDLTSEVPGRGSIAGFENIKIELPKDYNGKSDDEVLVRLRALQPGSRTTENIRIKLASLTPSRSSVLKVNSSQDDSAFEEAKKSAKALDAIIDENLKLIDEAIKANLYEQNKTELKKLTISEIFSRISKDTAYIMGYILDAGEQGYLNNISARDKAIEEENVIGLYYPMKFEQSESNDTGNSDLGKQVPVSGGKSEGGKIDKYGVDKFEKAFVNRFIAAIAEGIAQNKALQAQAAEASDDKIKHRINNIEIISKNPFNDLSDWREIASLTMKRSGLAGYLTQSNDPNKPGDYGNTISRSNTPEEMRRMADGDVTNITDEILAKLDTTDLEELKNFCEFWIGLLTDPDGVFINETSFKDLKWRGGKAAEGDLNRKVIIINPGIPELATGLVKNILNSIKQTWTIDNKVATEPVISVLKSAGLIDGKKNCFNKNSALYSSMQNAGFVAYTVEEYLEQFIGPKYLFSGRSTRQAIEGTKKLYSTLNATYSFHDTKAYLTYFNGLCFTHVLTDNGNEYEWLVFSDSQDIQALNEFQPAGNQSDAELQNQDEETKTENIEDELPLGISIIDSYYLTLEGEKPEDGSESNNPLITFYNEFKGYKQFLNYNWCKEQNDLPIKNRFTVNNAQIDSGGEKAPYIFREDLEGEIEFNKNLNYTSGDDNTVNVNTNPIVIIPYAQNWGDSGLPCPTGGFFGDSDLAIATRVFLRQFSKQLLGKIQRLQDETNKVFGQILGRAGEHEDLMYQQMHNLFHQWQILSAPEGTRLNRPNNPSKLSPVIATKLEEIYGKTHEGKSKTDEINDGIDSGGGFRYDYPLQSYDSKDFVKVKDALINMDSLYEAKANTTVLNIFQQICSKNNFIFFPIAGNASYQSIDEIFKPVTTVKSPKIGNFFQILFQPTPESRTLIGKNQDESMSLHKDLEKFSVQAFPVVFGDPKNKIIKNVTVGTDDNKVTAESIVNLQRIVDNENKNRTVTTDCSLLSVFEGRSYKAKLETMGNAQISPMQFFFLKNHAIFTGLYQIIKVDHNITPNDMTTEFEGIKMRYGGNSYGGVHPITLADFERAAKYIKNAENEESGKEGYRPFEANDTPLDGSVGSSSFTGATSTISTVKGSKDVNDYLKDKTKKKRIDLIVNEALKQGITQDYSIAALLSIASKESGFEMRSENMSYSKERLPEVWGKFSTTGSKVAKGQGQYKYNSAAVKYEKNPEKLANLLYSGKYGNGNEASGDGYKFRGRGFNQLTFKGKSSGPGGYWDYERLLSVELLTNPDLVNKEEIAVKIIVKFYIKQVPSKLSSYNASNINDFKNTTDAVCWYYNLTAGSGKSVSSVKALLKNDSLGGMTKAQERAPAFAEYVRGFGGVKKTN